MGVSYIKSGDKVLGIVILYGYYLEEGVEFFTPRESSLQLGVMTRESGHRVQPHIHRVRRVQEATITPQEVLFIRGGSVSVEFFDDASNCVAQETLGPGDIVMFVSGGHALRVIDKASIVEVKQGPYLGPQQDKKSI